jgi:adenylate cyclase
LNADEGTKTRFYHVVGFTPLATTMTPLELVDLLNEVFQCFDTLVEKYGLEKIKTIGDCYMVAAGVPRSRPDHAVTLVQLALDTRHRRFAECPLCATTRHSSIESSVM